MLSMEIRFTELIFWFYTPKNLGFLKCGGFSPWLAIDNKQKLLI